ncbi:MAG: hypothetical protein AAGG75_20715 [Bacteroidota bacterium]
MQAFIDDIISNFRPDLETTLRKRLAGQRGWGFGTRRRLSSDPLYKVFELFKGKQGKRLLGVMAMKSKVVEGTFRIYDYLYFGNIKRSRTTVFEFTSKALALSRFSIKPKSTLSSVKELFITSPPLFATTPEFNERYEIHPQDREAIKIDLNEDFLDHVGDFPDWTYEGYENALIAYQPGKSLSVEGLKKEKERFETMCERLINGRSASEFV